MSDERPSDFLDLYDFRLKVAAMYARRDTALRAGENPADVAHSFRAGRDALFAGHPQSAIDMVQRRHFQGLRYYEFDPEAVVRAEMDSDVEPRRIEMGTSGAEAMPMQYVAELFFSYGGLDCRLALYWIDVYGGGLFLPFRDLTAPAGTYGGGRYLVDTVKGSTFEALRMDAAGQEVILDFNYAYNPSCAYNPRWSCPLAPRENHLPVAIAAGEQTFP